MITQGSPLETVYRESEVRLEFVRKARYAPVVDEIVSMQRFIQNMRGLTASFSTFDDATFDQRAFEEHLHREVRPLTVCWYYILKLAARFMSGDHAEAIEAAERARALLWSTPGHMQVPEYHYYRALSLAAAHGGAPPETQREYLEALREHDAQFREWAENCPENFSSKSALVSAELARITGDDLEAMRLYERAIRSARDNGLVQNEAIACELASRFYWGRGFEAFADTYLRHARACYQRWGPMGRCGSSSGSIATSSTPGRSPRPRRSRCGPSSSTPLRRQGVADHLGEILFDRLLGTLLRVALEQGGAQRVCLFLAHGEDLCMEAEAVGTKDGVTTRLLPSLPLAPRRRAANARFARPVRVAYEGAGDPGRCRASRGSSPPTRTSRTEARGRCSACPSCVRPSSWAALPGERPGPGGLHPGSPGGPEAGRRPGRHLGGERAAARPGARGARCRGGRSRDRGAGEGRFRGGAAQVGLPRRGRSAALRLARSRGDAAPG